MSALRVGMKVKAVRPRYAPNAGITGTITQVGRGEYNVRWDMPFTGFMYDRPIELPAGTEAWADDYELEPLNPPKSQELVRWEDCPFTRDGKWREGVPA